MSGRATGRVRTTVGGALRAGLGKGDYSARLFLFLVLGLFLGGL